MGKPLDWGARDSGLVPDVVLSGHVNDYERFTRKSGGKQVPYSVSGYGGYYDNLHQLAVDAKPGKAHASRSCAFCSTAARTEAR
jgi:hypothetical protein